MGTITFPKGFLWGAATSAYQTEGDNTRSALWDWEAKKGWERSGEATRSWELFEQDFECLKALNLTAYRFSVEWSRIEPEPDRFDEEALARYAGWTRRLRDHGIRPIVSLHHFSEPAWLLRRHPQGWFEDAVPERFLRFSEKVVAALSDTVSDWIVFCEPMVFMLAAYGVGQFPPGMRTAFWPRRRFLPVLVRNFARTHNECYRMAHRLSTSARVGVAQHVGLLEPARPGDEEAVEKWDWFMHRNFLDQTKDCLDFLGLNYYTRIFVHRSLVPGLPMGVLPGYAEIERGLSPWLFRLLGGRRGDLPRSGMGWEIAPQALEAVVLKLWREYQKPILITESGVDDQNGCDRTAFIREHLKSLASALAQGADVRGYLYWSLLDNYEWGSYRPRFGLYTRERQPKAGAAFYADIAAKGYLEA